MARAEKGERLENEEDLVFDHKTKNHIRTQKLLDFCVDFILLKIGAILIITMLLIVVIILGHFIRIGEWDKLINIVFDFGKYLLGFILGILVKNKILQ